MKSDKINSLSHFVLVVILIAISYVLLMMGNGIVSLTHPDEVFYTQTAKEMISHHSYMTPYIFDAPHFEKPVFFFWLLIAAIKIFGLSAFSARFWPAFFGMTGVVATYWMAFMLFQNKRTAFLAGIVLSTSIIYVTLSRAALTDMVFSILVVLSLVFFYYAYSDERYKSRGILLCCISSAVAVLTKGALGFIFPLGVIVAFLIYQSKLNFLKDKSVLWGILLFLLIAAPWHILMIKLYGQEFITEYWGNVHIRRILEAEHQKSNTWYFYPGTMFAGVMPWSLFLIPACYGVYLQLRERSQHRDRFVFLLFWIGVVCGVMQVAQSKLASYIFPVFPAIAIILGYYLNGVLEKSERSQNVRSMRVIAYVMAVFLILVAIGAIIFAKKNIELVVHLGPIYVFSVLTVICAIGIFYSAVSKRYFVTLSALVGVTMVLLLTLVLGKTYAEPWVSVRQISELLKNTDQSDSTLICSKIMVRGVRFYTDRKTAVIDINGKGFFSPHPIPFLNDDQQVRDFLNSQPVTFCLVKKSNVKDLDRITQGEKYSTSLLGESGGMYLLRINKI